MVEAETTWHHLTHFVRKISNRNQIGRVFGGSITLMTDFFKGVLLLLIGLLPWLLLLGIPTFLVYRHHKKTPRA
jgi:hypothetical protein